MQDTIGYLMIFSFLFGALGRATATEAEPRQVLDLQCLIEAERVKPTPDISQIDWRGMSVMHVNTCLNNIFLFAGSKKMVELIEGWGFERGGQHKCRFDEEAICVSYGRIGDLTLPRWIPWPIKAHGQGLIIEYNDGEFIRASFSETRF